MPCKRTSHISPPQPDRLPMVCARCGSCASHIQILELARSPAISAKKQMTRKLQESARKNTASSAAFASSLVTGALANFPRACQPKRLRRRLRAENAARAIYLTTSSLATCIDNLYPTVSGHRSPNFGCGECRSLTRGINQRCWPAWTRFRHAGNGSDFDTGQSRSVRCP